MSGRLPKTLGGGRLVSSKARRSRNDLSDRLPKTLGGGRERSTPLSRRRLGDRGTIGAVDCRKLSTEAENALPLGLVEGSGRTRKRSRLGFADLADQDAGRRAKKAFVKKTRVLYSKICAFVDLRCLSLIFAMHGIVYCLFSRGAEREFRCAILREWSGLLVRLRFVMRF